MHLANRQKGFTLIELLIVVAIIGIIAAIAIPNLLQAMDRAKQKKTMADIKNLSTAIESYSVDVNYYPISTSMAAIATLGASNMGIEPVYIKSAPTRDGWAGQLLYGSDAAGAGSDYTITSFGKDRKVSASSAGVTNDFDCDIIYQNGSFTAYPEGIQT